LVPNFEWLEKHTILNKAQIEFLKNYEKAWTILTESPSTKVWIDFVDEETGEEFRNR
jgi:hypothetical protein